MDITHLSIRLHDAYQEMMASKKKGFEGKARRFERLLREIGKRFGIDQYNLARFGYHSNRELVRRTYLTLLEDEPETAELDMGQNLPVLMSVDMMDCGDGIAVIETNGFTSRGISAAGDVDMIAGSLVGMFKGQRRVVLAIGYPLREGEAKKSDDLVFEKILYSAALAKRMGRLGRGVRIVKYDENEELGDYELLVLLLRKDLSRLLKAKDKGVYLGRIRIDFVSDNLMRNRYDLLGHTRSINFNGIISDSKYLTYKAVESYLSTASSGKTPITPLFSQRINSREIDAEDVRREIETAAKRVIAGGRRILVKPDKGSGGGGIGICEGEGVVMEKIKLAEPYAPDGYVLVMECAPIVPVDLDVSILYERRRRRSGDLLKEVIKEIHGPAIHGDEVPSNLLMGRHAVDVRFYVVCIRGEQLAETYRSDKIKRNRVYLAPLGAIFRMAPGIWVDDPRALARDSSIIKSNISQEVQGKGAKVEHGILRLFVPCAKLLAAFGYEEKFKDFMTASFHAVKATIQALRFHDV